MRRNHEGATLLFGFAIVLVLIAGVWAYSSYDSHQLQESTRSLTERASRSAFVIGHIGRGLARVRAQTLEILTEPDDSVGSLVTSVDELNARLDADLAALPASMTPEEAQDWRSLAPRVAALRGVLARALSEIGAGRRDDAERTLDAVGSAADELADQMDAFAERGDTTVARALNESEHEMIAYRRVEALTFAALFLATLLIAGGVFRLLGQQRRRVAEHIGRIEQANRDLEAFAGRVAHDLKNALSPLQLVVPMLRKPDAGSRLPTLADRIERSSRRAVDLLEGLLAFARAGTPSGPARAHVDEVMKAVLEEVEPVRERADAAITVDVDGELAAGCTPALLHVLLLNLVGNAVKFVAGHDVRQVRVGGRRAGDEIELFVADTGPGIPVSARDRIFEPFFRVPGAATPGTGIGLATVRRVVDAYGGSIVVDDNTGGGTVFRVRLPAAASVAPEAGAPPAATATG